MKCKRCGSTDIREYHSDVISVGDTYFSPYVYVACADCGLHANYEEWLDELPDEENEDDS